MRRKSAWASSLEPAFRIRAELIGKQDALIAMLYDEQSANDEMKALKAEIDRQKTRLEARGFVRNPNGRR